MASIFTDLKIRHRFYSQKPMGMQRVELGRLLQMPVLTMTSAKILSAVSIHFFVLLQVVLRIML